MGGMEERFPIFRISRSDVEYPVQLKNILDPPEYLYIRGCGELLRAHCFAAIGSRAVSQYGAAAAHRIIPEVAQHFVIVSGMAIGADAVAHVETLKAGGKTIAVLGSGIDDRSIYPKTHISLAYSILESGGCIISEYPPDTGAHPRFFPARNRIIAGLSLGILIIEAARESGTMITARLALDYSRDVFAVPGSIFSKVSEGTNELLGKGAVVATRALDILEYYGIAPAAIQPLFELSRDERHVYDLLSCAASEFDELLKKSAFDAPHLMGVLSSLELQGLIGKQNGTIVVLAPH